ncbi:MAG: TetR/AcrR family transcriptional regulator [Spirochaetes bacterium]|nr:TetR/AcrR family transcriptional regulator [Spirochaetota bacterium]
MERKGKRIRCAGKDPERARDRILSAAKKEFAERGFSGARMSAIAKGAAVNKALIHYYFSDKDTLYEEVLRQIFRGDEASESIPEYLGKWDLTPSQKLYVIIFFIVNIFTRATDPEAMRILFWEVAEGKRYLEALTMEFDVPRKKIFSAVVEEGIAAGEFETEYPMLAASNISSFISFYCLNKEFYGGKPLFRQIYGDANDVDAFNYVLESVFKSLKPRDRELLIPEIPGDLKLVLNDILRFLVERKNGSINEEVFRRIDSIMHDR